MTDVDLLMKDLLDAKEKGYAIDNEEYNLGVRCIASPIYDHRNKVVAAVGISGPVIRMKEEKIQDLADVVKNIARTISQRCGYIY
jgi:DNA-binding IclR family transcriptional regulator